MLLKEHFVLYVLRIAPYYTSLGSYSEWLKWLPLGIQSTRIITYTEH